MPRPQIPKRPGHESTTSYVIGIAASIHGRTDWHFLVEDQLALGKLCSIPGSEWAPLLGSIKQSIDKGKFAESLALCRTAASIDPDRFVREARRGGVFRASKYHYRSKPLMQLVEALLADVIPLKLSEADIAYLGSVCTLLLLADEARSIREQIVADLRKRSDRALKSLFVCVDRAFRPVQMDNANDLSHIGPSPSDHFSAERKAEAFSLVVSLFKEAIGIDDKHFVKVDERGIKDGIYEGILRSAAKLKYYENAETKLDAYPFSAEAEANGVLISPSDPKLEQSIRLGFIQTTLQSMVRQSLAAEADLSQFDSLDGFTQTLHSVAGAVLIRLVSEPVSRYVMAIPLEPQLLAFFRSDRPLREELLYLESVRVDAFAEWEWMLEAPIQPGVSVMDLIKTLRYFAFMTQLFFRTIDLHPLDQDRDGVDMRSRLPVYRREQLVNPLAQILGPDVATKVLDLLTFDPSSDEYFDIQYRPLVKSKGYYLIPLAVLANSNIVRNVLCQANARLMPKDKTDPMQTSLATLLRGRGFLVSEGVERKVGGKKLEIDILAYSDGHLFVWECKNAFHPCNDHEMRTSYDHIRKAGSQLTRASVWLALAGVQSKLFKELGWPTTPASHITTCIVTANRIFNGYQVDGHPVRHGHEMANVLTRGLLTAQGKRYRLWKASTFCVDDLRSHIQGETIVQDNFDSMVEQVIEVKLRKRTLAFKTYALDVDGLLETFARRYSLVIDGES